MGKAPHQAEEKNVEIYLRVKPTPKASRNVSLDMVRRRKFSFLPYKALSHFFIFFLFFFEMATTNCCSGRDARAAPLHDQADPEK